MALVQLGGVDVRLAELAGRSTGAVLTFFGHRHLTFAAGEQGHQLSLQGQGASYLILNLVNLALAPWVVWFLVDALHHLVAGKLAAEVVMTIESYVLTALVFKEKKA